MQRYSSPPSFPSRRSPPSGPSYVLSKGGTWIGMCASRGVCCHLSSAMTTWSLPLILDIPLPPTSPGCMAVLPSRIVRDVARIRKADVPTMLDGMPEACARFCDAVTPQVLPLCCAHILPSSIYCTGVEAAPGRHCTPSGPNALRRVQFAYPSVLLLVPIYVGALALLHRPSVCISPLRYLLMSVVMPRHQLHSRR